jgi:hypothetical protein
MESPTTNEEDDKSFVPEYKYSPEEFKKILNLFYTKNWPVQLLLRDHYGICSFCLLDLP